MYKVQGSEVRHDLILNDWYSKLKSFHPCHDIRKKFTYPGGEVDIMDCYILQDIFYFNNFEVKSNFHLHKAREQLQRFEDYLKRKFKNEEKIINSYQVYGIDDYIYKVQHISCKDGLEFKIGGEINGRKNIKSINEF